MSRSNPLRGLVEESAWGRLSRLASRCAAAGVIFTSCACSSLSRSTAKTEDPFLSDEPVVASRNESAAERPAAARLNLRPSSAIQQASYAEAAAMMPATDCPLPIECLPCPPCAPDEYFPDEYLCDGGDREHPVHYSDDQMVGLDTEDTVAEFRDEEGRRRVKPANKICIYSPRFAAVATISAPIEDVGGGRPIQSVATVRGMDLRNRDKTFVHSQTDMTERFVTRVRGSGLETEQGASAMDREETLQGHVHTLVPQVDYTFLQTGRLHQSESAIIEKQIQAAVAWTRNQNPEIAATTDSAGELHGRFFPSEFSGQENRFNGKGRLRIVKLADKDIAAPGDVITFKIRFDNLGDRPLKSVVIVDNLTPRLEYVDDSATCDRNGELFVDDNGEGSLILRWELDEPLEGRSGGVVTFQARVR